MSLELTHPGLYLSTLMTSLYLSTVFSSKGGTVDRYEDWGTMKLAYNINKINKARYILLNFQANNEILDELANLIKFNDSIMRHMFLAQDEKITEPSVMMATRERA